MTNQEFTEQTGLKELSWPLNAVHADYYGADDERFYYDVNALCGGSEERAKVLSKMLDAAKLGAIARHEEARRELERVKHELATVRCQLEKLKELAYEYSGAFPREELAEAYGKQEFCVRYLRDGLELGENLREYVADLIENK